MRSVVALLSLMLLVGCTETPTEDEQNVRGGVGGTPAAERCSCSCNGSNLIRTCPSGVESLGDYGSRDKCAAQLPGHPGCR